MARLSRHPFETFSRNLSKARGIVRLQFYVEDLFLTGGQESLGRIQKFVDEIMKGLLGPTGVQELIQTHLAPVLEARFKTMDPKETEKQLEAWVVRLTPIAVEIQSVVDDIQAATKHGLLEQALVATTSALEVYISDVTRDAIRRNVFIQRRFATQMVDRLTYRYSFYDVGAVQAHVRLLLGRDILTDKTTRRRLDRLLAYRNLIAHRAGLVDRAFKTRTGYGGRVGLPVKISREEVEQAIAFVEDMAANVEITLRAARAPRRRRTRRRAVRPN